MSLLDTDLMVREIVKAYGIRNRRYMEWADEPAGAGLEAAPVDEDEEPSES